MTTKSGYTTNGNYIKYKSGFTGRWIVETENDSQSFKEEFEADTFIKLLLLAEKDIE